MKNGNADSTVGLSYYYRGPDVEFSLAWLKECHIHFFLFIQSFSLLFNKYLLSAALLSLDGARDIGIDLYHWR